MTSIRFEDEYQVISVELKKDDMLFSEFMEQVVGPIVTSVYCEQLWAEWSKG